MNATRRPRTPFLTTAALVLLGALRAGTAWGGSICPDTPPDPSICPPNMPPAEALDPIFLIGSATGRHYYEDCGLVDQLVACGWPPEKIVTVYRQADPECVLEGAAAMFAEVEAARRALGADKIDLFGYSIGGPRVWSYLTLLGGWRHVNQVVLWGSPNYGLTYTPFTLILGMPFPYCWHADLAEKSDFNRCIQGTSNDPECANPFRAFPPMAVPVSRASEGIVYYNVFSDDLPCLLGSCTIWCDEPGRPQAEAHPNSDCLIVGENARMPNVYNIDCIDHMHWDFLFRKDPEVWAQTMLGFLGREPTVYCEEDGDEIPEAFDNCPFGFNPDQVDGDDDGLGDACDPCTGLPGGDLDSDGICDAVDNCPRAPNPAQADTDGDGTGDLCDECEGGGVEICNGLDDDCDGIVDDVGDADRDGFDACADCDDGDARVYPGAEEIPDDGIDQNCNGRFACSADLMESPAPRPVPWRGVAMLALPVAILVVLRLRHPLGR